MWCIGTYPTPPRSLPALRSGLEARIPSTNRAQLERVLISERVDGSIGDRGDGGISEKVDGGIGERVKGGIGKRVDGGIGVRVNGGIRERVDGGIDEKVCKGIDGSVNGGMEQCWNILAVEWTAEEGLRGTASIVSRRE